MHELADVLFSLTARTTDLARRIQEVERVGLLPHVVDEDTWLWQPSGRGGSWVGGQWGHGSWTGGFAGGCFLAAALIAAESDDRSQLLEAADVVISRLEGRVYDVSTHDLGFLFWPSAALGYEVGGSDRYRAIALQAARTLMSRRHPSGLLLSWGDPRDPQTAGISAIDTMMNLPLLWWAGRNGLSEASDVARAHADATARYYFRDDGSVWHYIRVDSHNHVRERGSKQGLDADSAWSRGLSWAVHGFVTAHLASGEERYLDFARKSCRAFLDRLGDRTVPPYDFAADSEGQGAPSDASAAAVVSSALQQALLSGVEVVSSAEEVARSLTEGLVQDAIAPASSDGLLTLTSYSVPEGFAVDGGSTWGDFFLLRALAPLTEQPSASSMRILYAV